jgi:hypothetical protein
MIKSSERSKSPVYKNIKNISLLEILSHLILEKAGSPLSLNSLRDDLKVSFETVRNWTLVLNQFFYSFPVPPFASGRISRAIHKEKKFYVYDWAQIKDEAIRFENMVALHLHKSVDTWKSMGEGEIDLFYIRDKEKRECDFFNNRKQ